MAMNWSKRARRSEKTPLPFQDKLPNPSSSQCTSSAQASQLTSSAPIEFPLPCGSSKTQPMPSQNSLLPSHSQSNAFQHGRSQFLPAVSNQDLKEADPSQEIQIIDAEGGTTVRRGPMLPADVWSLPKGLRIKVHLDSTYQPIKKASIILSKWLGSVAKKGDYCPLYTSWHKVNELFAEKIIKLVRSKFIYPGIGRADSIILRMINKKWRDYKCDLKAAYFNPDAQSAEIISNPPNGIDAAQWAELVQFWFSAKGKFLAQKGKEAHQSQLHTHASCSQSFAKMMDESELAHGEEPGRLSFFKAAYRSKDGTDVNPNSQDFVDRASTLMAENQRECSSESSDGQSHLQNEVRTELDGPEECQSDSDRAYDTGASPQQSYGVDGHLDREDQLISGSDTSGEIEKLQEEVETMRRSHEIVCCGYDARLQRCEDLIQQLLHQQAGQINQSVPISPEGSDNDDDDDDDSDSSGSEDAYSEHGPNIRRTL